MHYFRLRFAQDFFVQAPLTSSPVTCWEIYMYFWPTITKGLASLA